MEATEFDEERFFGAIAGCGARVLLIGRRAMVALGLPVLTADYDLWAATDGIEALNAALAPLGLAPTRTPDEARKKGRYVLENDEHVDVLIAHSAATADGERLTFDDAWSRRQTLRVGSATVAVPSIEDLITTKRWSSRDKDVQDIRLLEALREESTVNRQKLLPEVEALHEARLPPEEFDRRLRVALDELQGEELENVLSLIRWFNRRYPTPQARLAYIRRSYARWTAGEPTREPPHG